MANYSAFMKTTHILFELLLSGDLVVMTQKESYALELVIIFVEYNWYFSHHSPTVVVKNINVCKINIKLIFTSYDKGSSLWKIDEEDSVLPTCGALVTLSTEWN